MTTDYSAAERRLRARLGGLTTHFRHDSRAITAPARAASARALDARLLDEIDPVGALPEPERRRRLAVARKAHFARLALRSAAARRKRPSGRGRKG